METEKKLTIFITTDSMGRGNEELGKNLMKAYLYSLTEADVKPDSLIFLNSGVYLTTEGSAVEQHLKDLEAAGVEILSCGACLDFFGLTEKLIVGAVTNMYANVERMHEAGKTIII